MGGGGKNSASNAEQAALNNQGQLNNSLLKSANQLSETNSKYYQPLLQGLASAFGNQANTIAPGLNQGLGTAVNSQGNLQSQTGINPYQSVQQLLGYTSQPGQTQTAAISPQLEQFYKQEQQQGINPLYAQNAQNQLGQASQQEINEILERAAPGTNRNALLQDLQSNFLQNSVNLQGNLAGQSQGFANQGAAGLAQTAGAQDTQKLGLLQAGSQASQSANAQALQNLLASISTGQSAQNTTNQFMQQGTSNLEQAMNALAGLSQQNAAQASQFGQQAQQQQSGKNSGLGGVLGAGASLMTGGAAGAGGLGSFLGKL